MRSRIVHYSNLHEAVHSKRTFFIGRIFNYMILPIFRMVANAIILSSCGFSLSRVQLNRRCYFLLFYRFLVSRDSDNFMFPFFSRRYFLNFEVVFRIAVACGVFYGVFCAVLFPAGCLGWDLGLN